MNFSYPKIDAPVVTALKSAGAIIIGKANMATLAGFSESEVVGPVLNPYGPDVAFPAGSSSGNGAGGASVFGVIGLGTDTGGSVIFPSSVANLIGLNLAHGKMNMSGVFPLSVLADRAGPMVRHAEDLALMLDELDPTIPTKPYYATPSVLNESGLNGLEIGYFGFTLQQMSIDLGDNASISWNPSPEIRRLIDRTLFNMREGGANVKICGNFTHQNLIELEIIRTIIEARYLATCLANDVDKYLRGVTESSPYHNSQQLLDSGVLTPLFADRLELSIALRDLCNDTILDNTFARTYFSQMYLEPLFSTCGDILIAPSVDFFPYKSKMKGGLYPHIIGCLFGYPQMSLPMGFSEPSPGAPKGLPLGLYAISKPGKEHLLVRLAYAYQKMYGPGPVLPASVPSQKDSSVPAFSLQLPLILPFIVSIQL